MNENSNLERSLGRLEGKMDLVLEGQKETHRILDEHEKRLNAAEGSLGNIKIKIGIAAALVGAIVTAAANWLCRQLTKQA